MKTLQTERNATHTLQSVSVLLIIRVEGKVPVCEWVIRGVGKGGGVEGVGRPPFLGANFIHFLYKVLGLRSVQKKTFKN